ncbi:MAG: hypothetical protein Q8P54_01790 [bacterium]|nr:hypothetical protein [bacterium]
MANNQNSPTLATQAAPPAGTGPGANPNQKPKQTKRVAKSARDQRQSVQNHLLFSEIRDGIVIMRDGSLRMVILASALNFDLKSPQEQGAIEYSFQGFLNGLHFPFQIIVKSRKLDLTDYLDKLDRLQAEQDNQLLAGLMEDYIYNVRGLMEEVNIMDKEFYVVVPLYVQVLSKENIFSKLTKIFKPNQETVQTSAQFEEHKRDLVQRANSVAQGLAQVGLKVAVLKTQEVVELFYNSYNLSESVSQNLISTNDMTSAAVQRGGAQPVPANQAVQTTEPQPDDIFSAAAKRQYVSPETSQVSATQTVETAQTQSQPSPAPQAIPTPGSQVSPGASAQVNNPSQGANV